MCAIAGIYLKKSHSKDYEEAVRRAIANMRHRGPDDKGFHSFKNAFLAHRRLSIIDLSSEARQPIFNENESISLIFNGEIYNYFELRTYLKEGGHKFRSNTDCEVILHLYEEKPEDFVKYLRGMFAFAIYDENKDKLLLARDRLGIKPLYYVDTRDFFLFSSEVGAILQSGLISSEVEPKAMLSYLQLGSIPSPLTMVKNVYSLQPGTISVINHNQNKFWQYWDLNYSHSNEIGENSAVKRISELLEDSVKHHMVSDVPVGLFLSGGIDSSSIAALAMEQSDTPLKSVSIAFEGTPQNEADYARLVGERYGTDHHEVSVDGEMFYSHLSDIFDGMDQPTIDGVNTYFVSKATTDLGLKVALSGLGGDEVFFGYDHYRKIAKYKEAIWLLAKLPYQLRKLLLNLYGSEKTSYLGNITPENIYMLIRAISPPEMTKKLTNQPTLETPVSNLNKNLPLIEQINYMEIKRYLHDQLLRDADVMGMAHSLEIRVPLLDHKLVEFSASLPPAIKLKAQKWLLIKALKDRLPEEITSRKKMGFTFPMDTWIKQYSEELKEMSNENTNFRKEAVEDIWNKFLGGKTHWSRPWSLVVMNQWLKKNMG